MDYEDLLYSPKISGKNKPRGKADAFQASLGHKRRYPNTCDSEFWLSLFLPLQKRVWAFTLTIRWYSTLMDISSWACDVLFLYIYVIWECKRTNGFPSKYTPRFYFSDFFMYLAKVESFFWFSNIATPTSGKSGRHIQRHLRPRSISLPKPAIKESVTFWCVGWSMNVAPEATMPSSPASPPTTSPASSSTTA